MTLLGWIICTVLIVGAGVCGLWASVLTMEMTDKVNSRLSPKEHFPILFGNLRFWGLRREYRRLFPEGDLFGRVDRLIWLSALCFLLAIVSGLFFRLTNS